MCSILGIWVSQEHSENRDPKAKMIVANYTSALDHLAVELVMPNISVSSHISFYLDVAFV